MLWRSAARLRARFGARPVSAPSDGGQDLDVYWNAEMAALLETWGEGNAWNEVQLLLRSTAGPVLDIACGTGKVMDLLKRFRSLEVHGCDISDFLLAKALARGIPAARLTCCNAMSMPYRDDAFQSAYSIGSLEHFTEDGIVQLLRECRRVVRGPSFHMVPVSASGRDEGWIKPLQSYFNNSTGWWIAKCKQVFPTVGVLDSVWQDERSRGKWLVCER
jgi:ubiquinone/menaquinone biosynthesis C-methylase UbiE